MNIFQSYNERIADFVHQPGNEALRRGTGAYSTPFRGSLFGLQDSAAISARVAAEGVDVLWLGSNPNVPTSVQHILNDGDGSGDFESFDVQVASGRYGHHDAATGTSWDAMARGGGWATYRRVFEKFARPDRIAFANFIPWGSAVAKDFWKPLAKRDPGLLQRLLAFADRLNEDITRDLSPKLIVVPRSLGDSKELAGSGISSTRARVQAQEIQLEQGKLHYATGKIDRAGKTWNVAYLRHPSSLHLREADRERVVEQLGAALATAIAA